MMYRAPYPLRGFDEECRQVVAENLHKRGVHVHAECTPTSIERGPDGTYTLKYKDKHGVEKSLNAGKIMFATGRKPSTKGIGLEVSAGAGGGGANFLLSSAVHHQWCRQIHGSINKERFLLAIFLFFSS